MGLNPVFIVTIILNVYKMALCEIQPQLFVLNPELDFENVDSIPNYINRNEIQMFRCHASYPIKWSLDSADIQFWMSKLITYINNCRRTFVHFMNPSTYRYECNLAVDATGIKLASQIISCRHVEIPEIYKSIQVMYNSETDGTAAVVVKLVNNTRLGSPINRWKNSCPYIFHIQVKGDETFSYKCENMATAQLDYKKDVRPYPHESSVEVYSSHLVSNPKCIKIVPTIAKCDGCNNYNIQDNQRQAAHILFCSANQTFAGVVFYPPMNKTNPKKFYVFQRPMESRRKPIQLEYVKHPVYYVGEEVIIRLSWWKTKYYYSRGDLYITVLKDNVHIYNGTIKFFKEADDWLWTREDYPDLTFNKSLTFKEAGTMVFTIYAPPWNSSKWINGSAEFIVKDPATLYFPKPVEDYTFSVGDKHRSLKCDPKGIADDLYFTWNKDSGVEVENLSSTSKILFFEFVHASTSGKYSCTAQTRVGNAKTKHFYVTVQEKDHTTTYVVVVAVVLAAFLLLVICGLFYCTKRQGIVAPVVIPLSDIKNFENGTEQTDDNLPKMISSLPYNKKYEVKRKQIKVHSSLLGSGEFGVVYKGGLVSLESLETIEVAVKTVKPNANVAHIASILNELKVLSYLDNGHPNILNIIGAYTSKLRNGEVLICVELCKDSLLNILRKTRESGTFQLPKVESNRLKPGEEENVPGEAGFSVSVKTLMSWSYQIADGMEFLHTKHVIHGDLAARNILISLDCQVKIADFGLGRVLENYKEYFTVKETTPLPVKWMAIETLDGKKFSFASDVWAFGVTVWEIFSLGDPPYAGLHWNSGFIQELKNGFRLERPKFGSDLLYELMSRCWESDPEHRPDFGIIRLEIAPYLD